MCVWDVIGRGYGEFRGCRFWHRGAAQVGLSGKILKRAFRATLPTQDGRKQTHRRTHKPTNTLMVNFHPLMHTSDLVRMGYFAQLGASSEGILCQCQSISCFSTFPRLFFVLDPRFESFALCKCPTWTREGSTATLH